MTRIVPFLAAALVCMISNAAPSNAASTCAELRSDIQSAGSRPGSTALRGFHEQAMALPNCDQALVEYLLRRIAVAMSREAETQSLTTSDRKRRLEASLEYHRLWQVLKSLGDIAYERRDYESATLRYQQSLESIDDPETTADRHVPDGEVIGQIYRLAEMTRLVAQRYVAAPVNRAGEPTGLGAGDVRGFTFSRVAVPVTFVFAKSDFDPEGARAADDLLAHLRSQGSPDITLIGHTDPVGSRTANQALSERRANSVASFLSANGYEGNIRTSGRGEDEGYAVPDPTEFSQDELHRLYRRVEIEK